jgi:hypothetical protein
MEEEEMANCILVLCLERRRMTIPTLPRILERMDNLKENKEIKK